MTNEEWLRDAYWYLTKTLGSDNSTVGEPNHLYDLSVLSLDAVRCAVGLGMEKAVLARHLTIVAESITLMCDCSWLSLPCGGVLNNASLKFGSRPSPGALFPSKWLQGYFAAVILRRRDLIERLCKTPPATLQNESNIEPEYRHKLVAALIAFETGNRQHVDLMMEALDLTDPAREDVSPEWTLYLDVPIISGLFHAMTLNPDFNSELEKAVQNHLEYWLPIEEAQEDWDGLFALELTAATAIAVDGGLNIAYRSPRVPWKLSFGDGD